ncbi:MAG: pirin family protein, partial [Acidobacteria bacterium]|nr:pirin family protein [Acidobacteriota bacterium]
MDGESINEMPGLVAPELESDATSRARGVADATHRETRADARDEPHDQPSDQPCDQPCDGVEYLTSHRARVGSFDVRRAIPQRRRRTIGAWCFADHMGPADVTEGSGLDIGPHPHTGLQTVTWLLDGQVLHRDSLGSAQVIRAGELNLMSAGLGVTHSEEATGHYRGILQGIQLWIAQDDRHRHAAPSFEHHGDLPRVELGEATATVLVGEIAGARSGAHHDGELCGADVRVRGSAHLPLEVGFEYGIVVLEGLVGLDGRDLGPGTMGYLAPGRDELRLTSREPSTVIVLGGAPMVEPIFVWWNFVARSRAEIDDAYDSWRDDDGRFGRVASTIP